MLCLPTAQARHVKGEQCPMLTHRERVLRTLRFEPTDRAPYDFMEGFVWPELMDYFTRAHGLRDDNQIFDFLDLDCRWVRTLYQGPEVLPPAEGLPADWKSSYSDALYRRPLSEAETVADVEAFAWPDPKWKVPPDFGSARQRWPDHALAYFAGWNPLFCGAANLFGMEEALVKMVTAPRVFEACVARQNEYHMDILRRGLEAGRDLCDICWLADDYASNDSLLMEPALWRRLIKPYLAQQVRLVREHGVFVLFHSCGAVRSILPDLIDIGVHALLVFQTSARGMDARSIAREFGGHLAFYGGVDCQHLLTFGTPDQVEAEVAANLQAFARCGGYLVANSHHGIANIRGENLEAMCRAARSSGA
jgi:uroporphyrinogen decarboxylase